MEINRKKSLIKDLNNFPSIKLVISMAAGIITANATKPGIIISSIIFACFMALMAFCFFSNYLKKKHALNFLNGLAFAGLCISFGMLVTEWHRTQPPNLDDLNGRVKCGIISQPVEERPKTLKTRIQITDMGNQNVEIAVYFQKDSTMPAPKFGDLVAFFSDVRLIKNNGNPLEFNYKQYMERQGVYCSSYIKSDEYEILQPGYQKGIRYYGNIIRNYLIDIYRNTGLEGKHLAILEALTLGYKGDLDAETVASFQTSGAMHILAVSGLHTGIIMLVTTILLKFMEKWRKTRILRSAIIIGILWLFAAVTGFSNSVCRSALMFSLIILGQTLNRRTSTFNTISFSAVVLLAIDPMLIFNVGFGLSYLAVLSIITIMPLTQGWMPWINWAYDSRIKNVGKLIWQYILGIMLVSVAAQAGTSVLSIRTFNIFPIYFLITNIAVIPLSYLIMVTAIIVLITSTLPVAGEMMVQLLRFWLDCLIKSVEWIEGLPMSSITNIHITNWAAIFMYISIALLVIWIHYKKWGMLKLVILSITATTAIMAATDPPKYCRNQIIVYNENHTALYSVCHGGNMEIIYNVGSDEERNISPAMNTAGLLKPNSLSYKEIDSLSMPGEMYHEIYGKKFYIVNNRRQVDILENENMEVDCVIISDNTYLTANDITSRLGADMVIFDSSCSNRYIKSRETEFYENGIMCYNVKENGAYVYGDAQREIWWY